MESLTSLGTGGVVIIAVIMLIRELKPFILRNGNGISSKDLHEEHERMSKARDGHNAEVVKKMDKQTELLTSIDRTQALTCQRLDIFLNNHMN